MMYVHEFAEKNKFKRVPGKTVIASQIKCCLCNQSTVVLYTREALPTGHDSLKARARKAYAVRKQSVCLSCLMDLASGKIWIPNIQPTPSWMNGLKWPNEEAA